MFFWGYARDHNCPRVAHKRITEYFYELAPFEWYMDLVIVQSTNALLESQKALVDFCTFNPAKNHMEHQEVQNYLPNNNPKP